MANITTDFIPCMLIPLQQHYLLLPNSTIAEVIPMPRFQPAENKPTYWVGHYAWQNQDIAIIDLESIIDQTPYHHDQANKLCVLYSINDNALPAYALPCHGAPQLIHLNESALKLVHDDTQLSPYLHCRTHIGNKIAYIPNLDKLEDIIVQHC